MVASMHSMPWWSWVFYMGLCIVTVIACTSLSRGMPYPDLTVTLTLHIALALRVTGECKFAGVGLAGVWVSVGPLQLMRQSKICLQNGEQPWVTSHAHL